MRANKIATIYHQIGVNSSLKNCFNAVATLEGISAWWTPTSGDPLLDGELTFSFGEHSIIAIVTKYQENKIVEWTVQGKDGEWLHTRICFELLEKDDQVLINFQHADWKDTTEMFAHCSTKWAVFLVSMKKFLETGQGQPFPIDEPINHY